MSSRQSRLLLMLAVGPLAPDLVASQSMDSVKTSRPPILTAREAIGAAGGLVIAAAFDTKVKTAAQTNRNAGRNGIASIGNSFGNGLYVGPALAAVWIAGKASGHEDVSSAAIWAAGSGAVAGVATLGIKAIIGRRRPPGGDAFAFHPLSGDASFPSGHTSFAFAIASSLAYSTKDHWSDVIFYSAATLTGLSRINDNKHWLSDVVGGAVLGILVGRQLHYGAKRTRIVAGPGTIGFAVATR